MVNISLFMTYFGVFPRIAAGDNCFYLFQKGNYWRLVLKGARCFFGVKAIIRGNYYYIWYLVVKQYAIFCKVKEIEQEMVELS